MIYEYPFNTNIQLMSRASFSSLIVGRKFSLVNIFYQIRTNHNFVVIATKVACACRRPFTLDNAFHPIACSPMNSNVIKLSFKIFTDIFSD